MSPVDLLHECRRREFDAREAAADSARYAAWQRSPEGQAKRTQWIGGGPECGDADAASSLEEARLYAGMQKALGVVEAAQVLIVTLPNQHLTAEWQALRESLVALEQA